MASITYKFEKITWPGKQYGPCRVCGKKAVVRQKTFSQTVNPFNKDKETGRMKTRTQIQKEVREQAQAWSKLQPVCTWCD
jgi:hypothetical protein